MPEETNGLPGNGLVKSFYACRVGLGNQQGAARANGIADVLVGVLEFYHDEGAGKLMLTAHGFGLGDAFKSLCPFEIFIPTGAVEKGFAARVLN